MCGSWSSTPPAGIEYVPRLRSSLFRCTTQWLGWPPSGGVYVPALPIRCKAASSAVHEVGVVAEVHGSGPQGADAADRFAPGLDVAGLARGQAVAGRLGVLPGRVGRVADEQVELGVVGAHHDALVALGVAGRGDHLQAGQHLGVAVQQLEPRVMKPNHSYSSAESRRIRFSSARCT